MSLFDMKVIPTAKGIAYAASLKTKGTQPPRRTAPVEQEPGFYEPLGLWLYGNSRLLDKEKAFVKEALGNPRDKLPQDLDVIERQAEDLVLAGKVLVCGIHNEAHQRAALVPLRWGAPRILVFSGGAHYHLGLDLKDEPFRAARLWRHSFDSKTDLTISRRAPDALPTFASFNPTVDRLVEEMSRCEQAKTDIDRPFRVSESWPPKAAT